MSWCPDFEFRGTYVGGDTKDQPSKSPRRSRPEDQVKQSKVKASRGGRNRTATWALGKGGEEAGEEQEQGPEEGMVGRRQWKGGSSSGRNFSTAVEGGEEQDSDEVEEAEAEGEEGEEDGEQTVNFAQFWEYFTPVAATALEEFSVAPGRLFRAGDRVKIDRAAALALVRESDAAFPCTSAAIQPKTDAFPCTSAAIQPKTDAFPCTSAAILPKTLMPLRCGAAGTVARATFGC